MPRPSDGPVWVVGHNGMLGKQVCQELLAKRVGQAFGAHIENERDVSRFVSAVRPSAIINCAGVLPRQPRRYSQMAFANAVLPHLLASTGLRMVHMSTDCVYSGKAPPHKTLTDPVDLYGRSKLAGESDLPNVINVRGSFIGPRHGFLHWLLNADGPVIGWANAWWNGADVATMAKQLVALVQQPISGTIHMAAGDRMTKADMATFLAAELGLPVNILPSDTPVIYRALEPDVLLPPVRDSLQRAAKEVKEWRG